MTTTNTTPAEWAAHLAERARNRAEAARRVLAQMIEQGEEVACDYCGEELPAAEAKVSGHDILCADCDRCERDRCGGIVGECPSCLRAKWGR